MTKEELDIYMRLQGLRILCRPAFLYFLNHLKDYPGNYLEIGVFEGYSLRELAKAYPDKMIYGVDPFIEDGCTTGHNGVPKGERTLEQRAETFRNIEGFENIRFFEEKSSEWGKITESDKAVHFMNFSCILIDGDHSYEECSNDLKIALRCLPNGGVIWVDDQGLEGVDKSVAEFMHDYSEQIEVKDGDLIFIK